MTSVHRITKTHLILGIVILLGLNTCAMPDLRIWEKMRPLRKMMNKERMYWTDRAEYLGSAGTEMVFYKNGRPALERFYDDEGFLRTVTYLGRNGSAIRFDSLVYANDELIAGYYYSEPDHQLVMKFLSYKQQGQLSQRSWFSGLGDLLSREFFLFDRNGRRRMRMIFDANDLLLFSETFQAGTDKLESQTTYTADGILASQIRQEGDQLAYRYDFDRKGQIIRISQLHENGIPAWSSDLLYDQNGALERANFSSNGRFLFTHLGDLEFYKKSFSSWRYPMQANMSNTSYKMGHKDPFVAEYGLDDQGQQILDYRLPRSGALFKRSVLDDEGKLQTDTLYSGNAVFQPVSVTSFDSLGLISREDTYDLEGNPRWRHRWFRDNDQRVIREELTELPNTFTESVTRFYDHLGHPALSEKFSAPDSFDGSWVFYQGGGISTTYFYNSQSELAESWLFRPAGDTTQPSRYESIDYIRVESKYGSGDTLKSQRRFTTDGILNWELFFDDQGKLAKEIHRKRDGSIYKEVTYDPESKLITSNTYAPLDFTDVQGGGERKGELSAKIITRLNAAGETVQILSKNSSGQTEWEKRYAYREGKLVRSAQLDGEGKPVVISSYTHNEQGQVLTETAIDKLDVQVHTVENRYDEDQQLIWRTFSSIFSDKPNSNRFYYDEAGRLQRNEIIENQRFIEAIEYEYFPEQFLRIATHYDPEGVVTRKEVENYFEGNVFNISTQGQD